MTFLLLFVSSLYSAELIITGSRTDTRSSQQLFQTSIHIKDYNQLIKDCRSTISSYDFTLRAHDLIRFSLTLGSDQMDIYSRSYRNSSRCTNVAFFVAKKASEMGVMVSRFPNVIRGEQEGGALLDEKYFVFDGPMGRRKLYKKCLGSVGGPGQGQVYKLKIGVNEESLSFLADYVRAPTHEDRKKWRFEPCRAIVKAVNPRRPMKAGLESIQACMQSQLYEEHNRENGTRLNRKKFCKLKVRPVSIEGCWRQARQSRNGFGMSDQSATVFCQKNLNVFDLRAGESCQRSAERYLGLRGRKVGQFCSAGTLNF